MVACQVYESDFGWVNVKRSKLVARRQSFWRSLFGRPPQSDLHIQTYDDRWWTEDQINDEVERLITEGITDIQGEFK